MAITWGRLNQQTGKFTPMASQEEALKSYRDACGPGARDESGQLYLVLDVDGELLLKRFVPSSSSAQDRPFRMI